MNANFWQGKRVLITGHTGFKGSWLALFMLRLGANVTGYALKPKNEEDNYNLLKIDRMIDSHIFDIRNTSSLEKAFEKAKPDIVFHLAAQPIVTTSYEIPKETYEINIMGTINVLEAIRKSDNTKAAVIITTDKCYQNKEQIWGYRENDSFGGDDPYSSSKACAEIVTQAYIHSFFDKEGKFVATVRAGNVIGGGDWSVNRLVPDCIRALEMGEDIVIRNPLSVRPWQHVTEPLCGYIELAERLYYEGKFYCGGWNFGPDYDSIVNVREVCEIIIKQWGSGNIKETSTSATKLHENQLLMLDCTKAKTYLKWKPRLSLSEALAITVEWYKAYKKEDIYMLCMRQIEGMMLQVQKKN